MRKRSTSPDTNSRRNTSGAYYGLIRFNAVPKDVADLGSSGTTQVALNASVAPLVLIQVPGNIKESIEIVTVKAEASGKSSSFFTRAQTR